MIATTSKKRAAEIYGGGRQSARSLEIMETCNYDDVKIALAKPHTVLWQPLDAHGEHGNEWFEGEKEPSDDKSEDTLRHTSEPPPKKSLRRQAASIVAKAPHGEHALDEYERGVTQLMEAEPLWPIVEKPSDPNLAWLAGFGDDDDDEPF